MFPLYLWQGLQFLILRKMLLIIHFLLQAVPIMNDKQCSGGAPVENEISDNQSKENVSEADIQSQPSMIEPVEYQIHGKHNEELNWNKENNIAVDLENRIVEQYYLSSITIGIDSHAVKSDIKPATETINDGYIKVAVNEMIRDAVQIKPENEQCDERMDQHSSADSHKMIELVPEKQNYGNNSDLFLKQNADDADSISGESKHGVQIESPEKKLAINKSLQMIEYHTYNSNILSNEHFYAKAGSDNTDSLATLSEPNPATSENNKTFMPGMAVQPEIEKQTIESKTDKSKSLEDIQIKPECLDSKEETNEVKKHQNDSEDTNKKNVCVNSHTETDSYCKSAAMEETASKYFHRVKMLSAKTVKVDKEVIQDPQVSSGCNQGTQTDIVPSIDVASSPFVGHHSPISTKSIGIQCNFELADKETTQDAPESFVQYHEVIATGIETDGSDYKVPYLELLATDKGKTDIPEPNVPNHELISTGKRTADVSDYNVPKLKMLAAISNKETADIPKSKVLHHELLTIDKTTADVTESNVPKLGLLASSLIGSGYRKSITWMSYLSKNLGQSISQQCETEVISTNEREINTSMKEKDDLEEDSQSFATADSVSEGGSQSFKD